MPDSEQEYESLPIKLNNIQRDITELSEDFLEFRTEARSRLDAQDRRQERILWTLVATILTILGGFVGAVLTKMIPVGGFITYGPLFSWIPHLFGR